MYHTIVQLSSGWMARGLLIALLIISIAYVSTTFAQSSGVTEDWTYQVGTTNGEVDVGASIGVMGGNGEVYIGGFVKGPLTGQTHEGNYDAFVQKYSATGTIVWTDQFGTSLSDQVNGLAVSSTSIYVVGETIGDLPTQTASGGGDAFIRKYDTDGTVDWTRQFGTEEYDTASGVAIATSGVYVVGSTLGSIPPYTIDGFGDVFIRKYDFDGNILWTRQFGTDGFQEAIAVTNMNDSPYLAGVTDGRFSGNPNPGGAEDVFIRKYSSTGQAQFTRVFGSIDFDEPAAITNDGNNIYVTGMSLDAISGQTHAGSADVFVRSYNGNGMLQWTDQFGSASSDAGTGISANDGGIYVGGYTEDALSGMTNQGSSDCFIRKYTDVGTVEWTHQSGTSGADRSYSLMASSTSASTSALFLTGFTSGAFSGETNTGKLDIFVSKFTES